MDRVGAKAPARFLCIAEENSLSEIVKVSHAKADTLQDFGFVVTTLNITIRPGNIHGVQYFLEPVAVGCDAILELRHFHHFYRKQPVRKSWSAFSG